MGKVVVAGLYGMSALFQVRRFPKEGETVSAVGLIYEPGGKGYNQAVAAKRAGVEVYFATAVGRDFYGEQAAGSMKRDGLERFGLFSDERWTTAFAAVITDEEGENEVIVHSGACSAIGEEFANAIEEEIAEANVLLLQLEVPLAVTARLLKAAKAAGTYTILNPAPACSLPREILQNVNLLTPNCGEARMIAGAAKGAPVTEISQRLQELGCGDLVITMGSQGAFLRERTGVCSHQKPFPVQSVNSAGAGDTFNGALAARIAEGIGLRESVRYAAAASALAVSRDGVVAAIPKKWEVEQFLREWEESPWRR